MPNLYSLVKQISPTILESVEGRLAKKEGNDG